MTATPLSATAALLVVALSLLPALVRLIRGPDLADRVVAIELLSVLAVGIAAVGAVIADDPVYLDVGLVLSLVAFLGALGFARYAERGGAR